MQEVGRLWETGRMTVAQEHLATAIANAQLEWLDAALPVADSTAQLAVLAVTPGELHMLGARMLESLLKGDGWSVANLAAIPATDLVDFVRSRQPAVVGLSTALPAHLPEADGEIRLLRELAPRPMIMVGGAAYRGDAELARRIGADSFGLDAQQGRDLLRQMRGRTNA